MSCLLSLLLTTPDAIDHLDSSLVVLQRQQPPLDEGQDNPKQFRLSVAQRTTRPDLYDKLGVRPRRPQTFKKRRLETIAPRQGSLSATRIDDILSYVAVQSNYSILQPLREPATHIKGLDLGHRAHQSAKWHSTNTSSLHHQIAF